MAKILTLEEFKASKVFEPNYDPFECGESIPAWLYANKSCFIMGNEDGSNLSLVIENMDWIGSFDSLEEILYQQWYITEVVHHES